MSTLPTPSRQVRTNRIRRYYPLLAILILALAALACINTELTLTVTQQDDTADTLEVLYQQYLIPSYVEAAKEANQERAADFSAAGRDPGEPFLPTTREELKEAFNIKPYQDQGFEIQKTETGFSATKTFTMDKDRSMEDWKVRVIRDPAHPEQTTYRVKVYINLKETDLTDLQKLRNEPLMDKPDPNATGGGSSGGSGFIGDLVSVGAAIAEVAEEQMAVEMYYAQKALKNSDPMHYKVIVTLPGEILIHTLDGSKAGTLDGNTVTLILDESAMAAHSGKELVFHVESILKDCNQGCKSKPHLVWDGDESGVSCNCVCESGWTMVEGTDVCTHCDEICRRSDPNYIRDMQKCEANKCGCMCAAGMTLNRAGTKCITEAEAQAIAEQRPADGGPSPMELGELFLALMDPNDDRDINQMPGWFLLTSGEREQLLSYIEGLGLAVDRSQLVVDLGPDMTTEQRYQLILEEANRVKKVQELAIEQVKAEIQYQRDVHDIIIGEIWGNAKYAGHLLKVPEYIEKTTKTPYQLAREYVEGKMTDKVKDKLKQEVYGENPPTYQAAAAEIIKQIPQLATKYSMDDYYRYKTHFSKFCPTGCDGPQAEEAHRKAMDALYAEMSNGTYSAQRLIWAEEGSAYDRAFWKARLISPP